MNAVIFGGFRDPPKDVVRFVSHLESRFGVTGAVT